MPRIMTYPDMKASSGLSKVQSNGETISSHASIELKNIQYDKETRTLTFTKTGSYGYGTSTAVLLNGKEIIGSSYTFPKAQTTCTLKITTNASVPDDTMPDDWGYSGWVSGDVNEKILTLNPPPVFNIQELPTKLYEKSIGFNIKGIVTDDDVTVDLQFQVEDGDVYTAFIPKTAPQQINLNLEFKDFRLYYGDVAVSDLLTESTTYNLYLYSTDNYGAKSTFKIPFTVSHNILPKINVVSLANNTIVFNVTEPELEDSIRSVEIFLNNKSVKYITDGFDSNITYKLTGVGLKGGINYVDIVVTDNRMDTVTKRLKVDVVLSDVPYIPDEENFRIDGAFSTTPNHLPENFQDMDRESIGLDGETGETRFIFAPSSPNTKNTLRISFTRKERSIDYEVHHITGVYE